MAVTVYFDGKLIKQLGTYVKTDLSAVRTINGVGTGITALLGLAEGGELNKVYKFTSYQEAASILKGGPLLDHIKAAFIGGAGEVAAIRIGLGAAESYIQIPVQVDATDTTNTNKLLFTSYEKSNKSNQIYISFELDTNFTSSPNDDTLIVTIYQKHPDFSLTKEVYSFPLTFNYPTVLVKRNQTLFFVDKAIVSAALATGSSWQTTLINLLKDQLLPTDYVQIFSTRTNYNDPDVPVQIPLGLMIYELVYGGLFGYQKSRLVSTVFGTVSDLLSNPLLFDNTVATFFDGTNYKTFTDLSTTNLFIKSQYTIRTLTQPFNSYILTTRVFSLSGGSNGDDGTGYYTTTANSISSWLTGLSALEEEEINFVVPAYRFKKEDNINTRISFFKNISSYILAHITTMSQVNKRKPRIGIFGFPAPSPNESVNTDEYLNDKGVLNTASSLFGGTDRAQVIIFPFYSSVLNDSGTTELLGGEFFASYIAGLHCNREPQESITFLPVGGLGADPLYNWNFSQKDTLISNRILFVEKVKNSFGATVYRIHHNPTSWLGPVTQGFQEMVLRRIDDFLNVYVYKNVQEQFIGRESYGQRTANEIKGYVETLLSGLTGQQISAFRDVTVTHNDDLTVYYVEFFYQPVTEIKFILATMKVSFDLA
jgi:hypothetical protein